MEDKKDSFDLCYRIAKSKIPKIQEQYIHYNPIGQDIYNLATEINNEIVAIHDVALFNVFNDIDYYAVVGLTPIWLRNPYNVKMAEVLYRSMWLENWGSGAKRIIEACQEQGVEEPTWRWDGAFVYVTFKRPAKHRSSTAQVSAGSDRSTTQEKPNLALSSPQPRHNFAPTSPQVRQLVELMGTGDYTIKELTEMCGFIDPKHFREGYIKPVLRENVIERLYADRPNHPKQKYRLTEVAKEWKSANKNS